MARKVVCMIATSADGYIARKDGSYDWLMKYAKTPDHYGMNEFMASIDTILWGRVTWDQAQAMMAGFDAPPMPGPTRNYVFSSHPETLTGDAEFVTEPIPDFMKRLRAEPGKDIWMMGGGGILSSFLDVGEIDEMIVSVIPVYIGEGIPLIAPRPLEIPLRLISHKAHNDGVVNLHYAVAR